MADVVSENGPAQRSTTTATASIAPDSQARTVRPSPPRPTFLDSFRHRVRTKILVLLCLMYLITYMDRVNISTAAPFIKEDLGLDNTHLGLALAAFSIPYAFFQIFGGILGDKFGPRKVLFAVGVVWALATLFTGFAVGLVSLFAARLALGFGEGASFPTATSAMAKWLPLERRAFGQGITHAFARIGNAIAPLVVAGLIALWNWRLAFFVFGVISLLWAFAWVVLYRDRPADHPKMTEEELAELSTEQQRDARPPVPWKMLFARILPVTFVDFCYGWMLWVYLTWIPSFFHESYGLELNKFALFSALVLVGGVVGDTVGGVLSDYLLRRTGSLKVARRAVLVVGLFGLVRVHPADALRSPARVDHGVPGRGVLPAGADQPGPLVDPDGHRAEPRRHRGRADEHRFRHRGHCLADHFRPSHRCHRHLRRIVHALRCPAGHRRSGGVGDRSHQAVARCVA